MSKLGLCWTVLLVFILTGQYVVSKNVIFLPVAVTSHARLHAFVAVELAKMGHRVWLALPSALDKRNAETYPGVITFRYNDFYEESEDMVIADIEATIYNAITTGSDPDWSWIWKYADFLSDVYFRAMMQGNFTKYIETLQPDLLVLDWFPEVDERIAISYKLNIPFAILSALQDPITARIPFKPVAEAFNSPYIRSKANIVQKMLTILQIASSFVLSIFHDRGYMKQLFPSDPNVPLASELMSQAEVYIVESDPISDYPRPMVPNLKLIGGLSISPAKALHEPFKSFIERSEKAGVGVVVLSFGSLFMNLHKDMEAKILSALRHIKLNTIWRANITSPDPEKILTSTWLPVNDLLGHKNVKVFMSHSGTHSLYEALYHAVPTVCLPLFYDQQPNAERAEDKGYCINLDILKVSAGQLAAAIEQTASNKEMKSTLNTASEIYRQLYKNPRQEAAFWLDHVMRYGGSYMRYSGQKIPRILFVMDYILVFFIGIACCVCGLLITYVFKIVYIFSRKQKSHMKKD